MLFFLVVIAAMAYDLSEPYLITQDLIETVNSQNPGWEAGINPVFAGKKFSEIKVMLGALLTSAPRIPKTEGNGKTAPDAFDTYEQWPDCKAPIRDQGQCGSCWAVSGAQALSDRYCVAGHGNVPLSGQDLVSCESDEYACQGGYLSREWEYMKETGIVTLACFPYKSGSGSVPKCPYKCENEEDWNESKHKCTGDIHEYTYNAALEAIQKGGSIQAGFTVYQDFFSYKSGVYTHVSGGVAGGHAIKVQGWGVDGSTPYWNIANSWGTSWGMSGYFWMKRGTDECSIEDQLYACDVQ